jgi:hypothetical protein
MKYNIDYFIERFKAIPDEKWTVNEREDRLGRRCAHGHCYDGKLDVGLGCLREDALSKICMKGLKVDGIGYINNGSDARFTQPTPKERVLAALEFCKTV